MSKLRIGLDFDGVIVDRAVGFPLPGHFYADTVKDMHVTIITARPKYGDKAKSWGYRIERTMEHWGFRYDKVVYCNTPEEKIKYINKCGNIDLYVEDWQPVAEKLKVPTILFGPQAGLYLDLPHVLDWNGLHKLMTEWKLFSPGPVHLKETIDIDFSHRCPRMTNLYNQTRYKLRRNYKISGDYEIIFINGSATAAIESVISTLMRGLTVSVLSEGEFGNRLVSICSRHGINVVTEPFPPNHIPYDWTLLCQFETSCSKARTDIDKIIEQNHKYGKRVMVDAVSSFGYYPIPAADIIVTSSAKILGGLPVMGIVIIKKELLNDWDCKYGAPYYLDLRKYVESAKKGQMPHTALLPQLISLNHSLESPIHPATILTQSVYVTNHLTSLERIGDSPAPVLTFKFPKEIEPKKIYNQLLDYSIEVYMNPKYHKDQFQISCFSERDMKKYQYMVMVLNYLLKER